MKNNRSYESIIQILQNVKPSPESSEELTQQIMKQVTMEHKRFTVIDNPATWNVFMGVRNAMAVAAILLTGLFISQQWDITSKRSKLEHELSKMESAPAFRYNDVKAERFKQLFYRPSQNEACNYAFQQNNKSVRLEQNLTDVVKAYFQLQDENRQTINKIIEKRLGSI